MESGIYSDTAIAAVDRALRSVFAPAHASRPAPAPVSEPLPESERRESAALMRINHSGELAAQALYHGQALVARSAATREMLLAAAPGMRIPTSAPATAAGMRIPTPTVTPSRRRAGWRRSTTSTPSLRTPTPARRA